ncbi:MAG TPA: hypothetical protein PK605_06500 [Ignavibacteria bacterium]|mgnify:FL=1|nr:hypothetical protein [Ignavibacteria bacterium]HAX48264.1 hypothetical protein [Bacteroidota bacterium]HRE11588.1 hypothetical protein [Ignavibacteria bacterium]HRF67026.1 hypothetical protein [Ignavibacteria bacterium]HRJ04036.1 hypothetical protein [Ignavibacteria bacterium]
MKIITLLSIMFVLMFNACSGSDSEKSISLKTGKYGYVLSDSSGNSLVEGEMSVVTITKQQGTGDVNDYEVTGSYTITKNTADSTYQGFSTMNGGEMKGYYNDARKFININTNPRIADANVFINAIVKSKSIEGGWHYSTFRGTHNEGGLFKATKIKK